MVLAVIAAALPLPVYLILPSERASLFSNALMGINGIGWSFVLVFIVLNQRWKFRLISRAEELGVDSRLKNTDEILEELLFELRRKFLSFSVNLIQGSVSSEKELSTILERIVAKVYELLGAVSAELALFDKTSGFYSNAFLVGRPFKKTAQAMLSDASSKYRASLDGEIVIQPIVFAGEVIGTLRAALPKGRMATNLDNEIVHLLALQAAVAVANENYTEQLIELKSSSDQMATARTGFLANLSHEIRGPLGIILNATELILEGICGVVSAEQQKTLGIVQSNGKHLLDLINDVLDYSKVESGKLLPKSTEILLQPFLKEMCTIIRSQAIEKGHRLNYLESSEELAISCDRRHLRQMMINLLTNAVKYTPKNGVIDVWAERVAFGKIRISVRDTGIGIQKQDRAKVFEAFERIDNEYAMSQLGTGLGMPLTKRLAEVNGGRIDFESEADKGSLFFIDFDSVVPPAFVAEKQESKVLIDGKGDHILVFQKNDGERELVSKYLSRHGFSVVAASTKTEASEFLAEKDIKLMVVDNNIIDSPQDDVIVSLRAGNTSKVTPLVLLTSKAFVSDIRRYLKEGVDRCLIKPVPLSEIALICRNLIDGTKVSSSFDLINEDPSDVAYIPTKSPSSPKDIN